MTRRSAEVRPLRSHLRITLPDVEQKRLGFSQSTWSRTPDSGVTKVRDETYRRAVIGGAAAWTLVEFAVYPVIVFLWRWRRFNTLQLAKAAIEDIEEREELV